MTAASASLVNASWADPVWIHGLRAPRRGLALHPEAARLTDSQLGLGELAAQWLLGSSASPCFIGSRNRDLILTTAAVRGAVHLRVDRLHGTSIRLGAAATFKDVLQQGTFWAEPARIADIAVLVIPDALRQAVAPAYQISGLLWTTYADPGRTLRLDDAAWSEIATKPSADEIQARTSMRPARRARWERPPPARVEPAPSWKLRLQGEQRRHARVRGPGAITVMAAQIAVPFDVLAALGNPAAISVGLQRVRAGEVALVLAAATPEHVGYEVRLPKRTGSVPTLRLDARASWLRAIMGKGSYPVRISNGSAVVHGLIRGPIADKDLQRFPANVAALFTDPAPAPKVEDGVPGTPSLSGIPLEDQHLESVGLAS